MASREVIVIPGLDHGPQPIPLAVKIGPFLFSGSISGRDAATHEFPTDPEAQIALAFRNVELVVEAAGATTANIAKLDVRLRDLAHREIVNREWLRLFPDEADRPARHTTRVELAGDTLIQIEIIAVL